MKLIAGLIVRNELGRYLEPCVDHLLGFCDEVVVVDDASDDGTLEFLTDHLDRRLVVYESERSRFFVHEGNARQALLDVTLAREPTHVLSIDADEFVTDGARLRVRLEEEPDVAVWNLTMEEVWKTTPSGLRVREDGGWRSHSVACAWRAPARLDNQWRIMNRKLACRRVPVAVLRQAGGAVESGLSVLHFGWADEAARAARHARYTRHDGGRFHASRHLASIMWPDQLVELRDRGWPDGGAFDELRSRLVPPVPA